MFRILKNGQLAKPSPSDIEVAEVLQFGVIHLLGRTTGVAILVVLGQWLYPVLASSGFKSLPCFGVSDLKAIASLGATKQIDMMETPH